MPKHVNNKKRLAVILTAAVLVLGGGGAAFAYWTSTGTGTGQATTGTDTAFVITSTAPVGAPLTPGGPSQTITFTVNNPGTGVQNLSTVTAAVSAGFTVTTGTNPACTAADYTVGTPAITYGPIAAGGNAQGTVTVLLKNTPTNQDSCKGALVPITFTAG